jgi:hypothetical protein
MSVGVSCPRVWSALLPNSPLRDSRRRAERAAGRARLPLPLTAARPSRCLMIHRRIRVSKPSEGQLTAWRFVSMALTAGYRLRHSRALSATATVELNSGNLPEACSHAPQAADLCTRLPTRSALPAYAHSAPLRSGHYLAASSEPSTSTSPRSLPDGLVCCLRADSDLTVDSIMTTVAP